MTSQEQPEASLEYWLNKAVDPFTDDTLRPENVKRFCDQVNHDLEGPQVACRLLAHKLQSPQEKEALNSLTVIDACVNNCGQRFHNEMGKFRFLNEVIKILSPKYLGASTPERVRTRTIELMYVWGHTLTHQPKIKQAYDMLKQQSIVSQDPKYMDDIIKQHPAVAKPRLATFEDEEKARLLESLLKSGKPDDLQSANRLIKTMVKEEEKRTEKLAQRRTDLETVQSNAKLLSDMLTHYSVTSTTQQELDIMKELYHSVQNIRPTLFKYCNEASDSNDAALAEILCTNDEVGKVIEDFQSKISISPSQGHMSDADALLSLGMDVSLSRAVSSTSTASSGSGSQLLGFGDDVALLDHLGTPLLARKPTNSSTSSSHVTDLDAIFGSNDVVPMPSKPDVGLSDHSVLSMIGQKVAMGEPVAPGPQTGQGQNKRAPPKGFVDLDQLSQSLIQSNLPLGTTSTSKFVQEQRARIPLKDIQTQQPSVPSLSPLDPFGPAFLQRDITPSQPVPPNAEGNNQTIAPPPGPPIEPEGSRSVSNSSSNASDLLASASPAPSNGPISSSDTAPTTNPLNDLTVRMEEIEPDGSDSKELLCSDKIRVTFHRMINHAMPDVFTAAVSITSTNPKPVGSVSFTARVMDRTDCWLKLCPPSGTALPSYNPLLPPGVVSQVMLVAKPKKIQSLIIEYTFEYKLDGKIHIVKGEFDICAV